MGMVCYVLGVSAGQMEMLRKTPSLVPDVTNVATYDPPDEEHRTWLARQPAEQRQEHDAFDKQWAASVAESQARLAGFGAVGHALSLDKSWHLLHFAITGAAFPTGGDGDALLLGEELGPDNGYGPARLHDARTTKKFAELLAGFDLETVKTRLRLREMRSVPIYMLPRDASAEAEIETQDYVLYHLPRLRDYAIETALRTDGLLIWLS